MADDSRKQIRGRTTTCPVCGREFWCYDPIQWAYRERTSKKRHICSWHCQVIHNEKQEKKVTPKPAKKKVEYHWIANLGKLMQEKGVSERKLAERTGFGKGAIGQWGRADTRCPDYKIDTLADALGVSRAELQLCEDRPDVDPVVKAPKQTPPPKEWHWLVNLGAIMQEKGISTRALSIRTGISKDTISQWRHLKARCQRCKLDILAEALGVTWEAITEKKKTAPSDGSDHTMPESAGNTDEIIIP